MIPLAANNSNIPRRNLDLVSSFIFIAVLLVLFFRIVTLPNAPCNSSHDFSSQAALEYYFIHAFQWGKDVIQNVGPYGFLSYPASVFVIKIASYKLYYNIIFALLVAYMLLWILWESPVSLYKIITISSIFLVAPIVSYYFIFYFAYLFIIRCELKIFNSILSFLVIVFIALVSLTKFFYFYMAIFLLISLYIPIISNKDWRRFFIVTAYFPSLIVFWLMAGQPLGSFLTFIYASNQFTSGYNEVLASYESIGLFLAGAGSVCLLVGLAMLRSLVELNRKVLAGSIILLFTIFVVWKHGFVRADGHAIMLFDFVFVMLPMIGSQFKFRYNKAKFLTIIAGMIISFWGSMQFCSVESRITQVYFPIENSFSILANWKRHINGLAESIKNNTTDKPLYKIIEIVGNSSIDYWGFTPPIQLYNTFNYHPEPMPISFAAFNSYLMEKNYAHYSRPESMPEYVLAQIGTIDGGYPGQGNSLVLRKLLSRYEYVRTDVVYGIDSVLLKKSSNEVFSPPKFLSNASCKFREKIEVPDTDGAMWVEIDMSKTFFGKIRSLLYKPHMLSIKFFFDDGSEAENRFLPTPAKVGFLVEPFLRDTARLINFNSKNNPYKSSKVKYFEIYENNSLGSTYHDEIGIAFYNIDINKELYNARRKIILPEVDAEIIEDRSAHPIELIEIDEKTYAQLHAPSAFVIKKYKGDVRLSGSFGFRSTAYSEGGATDGATFSVSFTSNGVDRLLFTRLLQPVENEKDRKIVKFSLALPPDEEGAILFNIHPYKNMAYDQTVIHGIRLERNGDEAPSIEYSSGAIPEVNAEIVEERLSLPVQLIEMDGQTYAQLHAPASFVMKKVQGETNLSGCFGFRDTAYTMGGDTDGAIFTITLVANGTKTVLLSQLLRPVQNKQDRELIDFSFDLSPDTRGTVVFDINPYINSAYDQTIIQNIRMR